MPNQTSEAPTKQFHATCLLLRMQLIRAAQSYDIDECLRSVRQRNLVSEDDETFIRACLAANEHLEAGGDGTEPAEIVSHESIGRIHVIVSSRLNVADSA